LKAGGLPVVAAGGPLILTAMQRLAVRAEAPVVCRHLD